MDRQLELSAAYARLVLQSGIAQPAELLAGTSLTAQNLSDMEFISVAELGQIFRNYDRYVNDCTWTARLGGQFHIGVHGPLGFAALSAPTLGEALDVVGTLFASRSNAMHASTFATDSLYVLRIDDTTGEQDFARWLAEVVMKIMEDLLATVLGHPVGENVHITFQHRPPQETTLAGCYHARVSFGAPENTIAVPVAWRQLPSPLHDDAMYRANVIKCRELIAARERAGSVAETVRIRLKNHFDQTILDTAELALPPTLEQTAADMHLTPRTLIRRLASEETSYRNLLEEIRRSYAEQLLQDARLKVADVAAILGYREAANFGRAFRRWYGLPPAAWRRDN